MAKKDSKPKYQGPKLAGDTAEARRNREKRELERAKKNAGAVVLTNAVFALQDEAFKAACDKGGIQPTARQASKWRNGYGAARKVRMSA